MEAGRSVLSFLVCIPAYRSLSQLKLTAPFSQGSLYVPSLFAPLRRSKNIFCFFTKSMSTFGGSKRNRYRGDRRYDLFDVVAKIYFQKDCSFPLERTLIS